MTFHHIEAYYDTVPRISTKSRGRGSITRALVRAERVGTACVLEAASPEVNSG